MKISLCQVNSVVGDLSYNYEKIMSFYNEESNKSDLVIFPELSLTGYLLKDIIREKEFLKNVTRIKSKVINATKGKNCGILLGFPNFKNNHTYNSVILVRNGYVIAEVNKHNLPNYGVFNEARNFSKIHTYPSIVEYDTEKLGILICEDAWHINIPENLYRQGATLFIVINASPYDTTKHKIRYEIVSNIAKRYNLPITYVNLVGGQDELVFDGGSFIINNKGKYLHQPFLWQEGILEYDTKNIATDSRCDIQNHFCEEESIYNALTLALQDYISKNKFQKVLLGLSGGIDSAIVAIIAADALGVDNIKCIVLPSQYNTKESLFYALELINNIGCNYHIIPINKTYLNFISLLHESYCDKESLKDITKENIQARIRAMILMAISNQEDCLLLSTSNKSESAVGYTTLYGDMCGSFSLIKDIYKTQVYKLAHWRNKHLPKNTLLNKTNIIPNSIINREPSAELRYNQKDVDSLPPYNILDKILLCLIERNLGVKETSKQTAIEEKIVIEITNMIQNSEFKRAQAPLGPKISPKSFNYDRIYPVTYSKNFQFKNL